MRKNKKGFTLVELVIVIAVIAILAAVLLPTFAGIVQRARFSSVTQRAEAVRKEVVGQYFDTAADMGGVKVFVKNDGKIYKFEVEPADEETKLSTGKWITATMTGTEQTTLDELPGTTAANGVSVVGDYRGEYGADVVVIIPKDAHLGTNVSGTTTNDVFTPDGLTRVAAANPNP